MLPLTAVAVAAATTVAGQTAVFSSRVELVYLDVFVTRDGAPVAGLKARHFEVRDEGVVQRVELLAAANLPLRTVLVLDTSGSLGPYKLVHLRDAARDLAHRLRADDPLELLTFDQELRPRPIASATELDEALSALRPSGGTALYDAIYAGLGRTPGPDRSVLIVFTDGEDNMSWLGEAAILERVRRTNAVVHAVGIRPVWDEREPPHLESMSRLARATGGRLWTASSAAELSRTFETILEAMRHRYLLRFEPSVARPGWHRLQVRLRGVQGGVEARPGYFAALP